MTKEAEEDLDSMVEALAGEADETKLKSFKNFIESMKALAEWHKEEQKKSQLREKDERE